MNWCTFTWTINGETYRCTQLAGHTPHNVHTSEGGVLHVETAEG
ncbi:hypothetical protein SEA_CRUNCHYBOI_16 [Microbacterium phage CrunchyBoi]|nr:hypothetical protein SEA_PINEAPPLEPLUTO_16 [Microbacterium phage PineapplePluto]QQO39359.1 hypothetical protein SEA_CRUNCHYBOI_16 [Microbacterium phage CrunchyBoi]